MLPLVTTRSGATQAGSTQLTPLAPTQTSVKGLAVRAGLLWVASEYGIGTVQAIYDRGSPQLRAAVVPGLSSFGILSASWYRGAVVAELLDSIDEITAPADLASHWGHMAESVAAESVHGIYKSLFRLISSKTLLVAHSQRVWSTYFSSGTLAVASKREGELLLTAHNPEHHPTLCRMTSQVTERVLTKIGFTGASVTRAQCQSSGAASCVFEVDYIV